MKVIFDLDGTLANNEHRVHLLPKPGEGDKVAHWTAFNKACIGDSLIQPVATLYRLLVQCTELYIVTGRAEDARSETKEWLQNHSLYNYGALYMRPVTDHRGSKLYKFDTFTAIGLEAGDIVVEDDPHVIEMVASEFPGVIIVRVPSACAAVQNGRSNNEIE